MAFTINREEVKPKSHSQDFIPSFIRKTYDILEEARFPQYIDWNPEGTALVIKKPSEFSQKVLPIYFKHNNFTSFVRQLNMYDFHKRRTQGLDHVYVHELFQKGKRHLLQEIKRKTHETASEKTPKANEIMETPKPSNEDLSSLIKENQLFKHLYNEAMNRLASLERRAKELAAQNQSLASQIHRQGELTGASIFKPIISRIESQGELTLDQLPMTMGKMSLNLTSSYQTPAQVTRLFGQSNAAAYMKPPVDLQREESSSVSTEVSRNSPLAVPSGLECEETVDNRKKAEVYNPFTSITRGCPSLRITSELSITRQEMSTGQMIDSWNFEFGGDDVLCFADQKAEKPAVSTQPVTYQDKSLLGKRMLDQNVDMSFYIPEPAMKRPELCIFTKKSIISSGVEDQEGTDGNFYGTNTVGIDLIEF